ncbi:hypothetical protein K9L05_01245 [Candidatus Babeliales bacterium]|nr:hypothetical protein [Candidatus Babeliales bacterium]MCF7899256.1 hypothetical protein [Candidatus Babeliales bacterium]
MKKISILLILLALTAGINNISAMESTEQEEPTNEEVTVEEETVIAPPPPEVHTQPVAKPSREEPARRRR